MSRALTTQELQILRSDGLATKVFAIIDQPTTVFSCRVNQTSFGESVAEITYNNASGTLAKVLPGMTVLVGSSAGAWDRGLVRVRKPWTSSIAYIGETSEITWQSGLYLTVIDEFSVWPRHLRISGETPYMDYDIAYSNQHSSYDPVVIMGTDRVVKLTGSSVNIVLDASQSWAFNSPITQYSWGIVSGNGTLINANTATPTLTVTMPGRVVISCRITAANNKINTGYRTIYVYDDATNLTEIQIDDLSGSLSQGGYEFSITLAKPVGARIRDYLKVILFCEYFPQSIGAVVGAENILAIGWIDEKECIVDEHGGQSRLVAKGAQYWLDRIMGYPTGIENTTSAPARWTQIQGLTVDKMLWHLLYWRSTVPNCVDLILSGDSRITSAFQAIGSLWDQIKYIAEESILATPFFDPYNRFVLRIHPNYLDTSLRSIPTIMTLTKDDYENIEIAIRDVNVSQYEVSGIDQSNEPIMAKSPGKVFGRHGQILSKERLLFSNSQNAVNIAGLLFARENRRYDFTIHLVSPIRVINLVPYGYLNLNIDETDTPAKVIFSGNVIPYRVEYTFSNSILRQTIYAEPEVFPAIARNIFVPSTPVIGTPELPLPDFQLPTWPALTPGRFSPPLIPGDDPLPPPEPGATCPVNAPANGPFVWSLFYNLVGNSTYRINLPVRTVIRSNNHSNKTIWGLRGRFLKLNENNQIWEETTENDFYNIYAYNSAGQRIATGLKDTVSDLRYRTGTFQPPAAVEIAYIGIEIEADLLRPTTIFSETEAGHFWDDWGRDPGELSWGYLGAGIWAFIKNAKLTYNVSWNVYTKLRLGGYREYLHVPFIIRQKTAASQNKGHILWAQGQMRSDALGWQELWYDDFPDTQVTPPYLWFVGKESQASGRDYSYISVKYEIRPSGETQIVMQHYIECWRKARYKIELQFFELWNVCPIPA